MRFTEKFRLPLYEAADRVLKEQFNETNQKVETAMASMLPPGVIVMWSGVENAIPEGWALCDGSNGTPNLRNRFVVGAGGMYHVGAAGGEATHTLTVNEMPSHTHNVKGSSNTSTSSIAEMIPTQGNYPGNSSGVVFSTGGGAAHNNLPPYYALCFIMKL